MKGVSGRDCEQERDRNVCRLVIVECGLRLRRARKGYVKGNGE